MNEQIEKAANAEIWFPVKGYEGLYEVSDQGRVRSIVQRRKWEPHVLKPANNGCGYLIVHLCKNSKGKLLLVHRLVAEAFCPNPCPDKFTEVNHRDENKENNASSNLEWCDRKHNINYSWSKQVQQLDKQGNILATYPSIQEAERVTRVNHSYICKCCQGKLRTSGGYVWRYKEV